MTNTDHARQNAASWAETLAELIRALEAARESEDDDAIDAAQTAISESPLSVEVRSGWYSRCDADPERAEYQDWGTPWTRYHPAHGEPLFDTHSADVLSFAQQFYFGE